MPIFRHLYRMKHLWDRIQTRRWMGTRQNPLGLLQAYENHLRFSDNHSRFVFNRWLTDQFQLQYLGIVIKFSIVVTSFPSFSYMKFVRISRFTAKKSRHLCGMSMASLEDPRRVCQVGWVMAMDVGEVNPVNPKEAPEKPNQNKGLLGVSSMLQCHKLQDWFGEKHQEKLRYTWDILGTWKDAHACLFPNALGHVN